MAGRKDFATFGASIDELKEAINARHQDAIALFEAGRYAAAIIMASYAVEIALKVVICRKMGYAHLPVDYQIHDLQGLVNAAGLKDAIERPVATRVIRTRAPGEPIPATLADNWRTVLRRSEKAIIELRYASPSLVEKGEAEAYLNALHLGQEGVLSWLRTQ